MKNETIKSVDSAHLKRITDEEWKYIPDTNNRYMVSNYGRVKSFCNSSDGKILKSSTTKGFKTTCIKSGGVRKTVLIHRLTAELFVEREPDEDMVIHIDWNKSNNYYKNLKWVNREAGYDRILTRLHQINRSHPRKRKVTNSKLCREDIEVLKTMLSKGIKQKVIAELFCISEMQVSRIKKGDNWGNVKINKN